MPKRQRPHAITGEEFRREIVPLLVVGAIILIVVFLIFGHL